MKEKKVVNILLADDDEDDRMIFTDIVGQIREDIRLNTVNDGEQLIRLLNAGDTILPDLIFLDLNMPNKNGKECLKEIKASPRLRHLHVIIYSTSGAEKDIRDAYQHGASLYIQKPSNIKGLKKTIAEVLSMDWHNGRPNGNRVLFKILFQYFSYIRLQQRLTGKAADAFRIKMTVPVKNFHIKTI